MINYFVTFIILLFPLASLFSVDAVSTNQKNRIESSLLANDLEAPKPKWSYSCRGTVSGATVTDMPEDDAVRSGLALIALDSAASYNYNLDWADFIPGQTVTTSWRLRVIDIRQDAKAVVSFKDVAGNDTTLTFEYLAMNVVITPQFYSFGKVIFGNSVLQQFRMENRADRHVAVISQIAFKNLVPNYSIEGISLPVILQPGEYRDFQVRFDASENGIFKDSLGVADSCTAFYSSYLDAKVGNPIINVSDVAFDKLKPGDSQEKEFYIHNTGSTELLVTRINGPVNPVFKNLKLPRGITSISAANPLRLMPNQKDTFKISFQPIAGALYSDSIIFESDADIADSIAYLSGEGASFNVFVNSIYDFGRKRIDLTPKYPELPTFAQSAIRLINSSNFQFVIKDIDSLDYSQSEAFLFDRAQFRNMIIPANDSVIVQVGFHPKSVGVANLKLEFMNDDGISLQSELKGIGTNPKYNVESIDFGITLLNEISNIVARKIVIKNDKWQYDDTLFIVGIDSKPSPGSISGDITQFGSEGFRFDKSSISLPMAISPGDSIELDAEFLANRIGKHSASLAYSSNAIDDNSQNLSGEGIYGLVSGNSQSFVLCAGESLSEQFEFKSEVELSLTIDSISVSPKDSYFSVLNKSLFNGLILDANNSEKIFYNFDEGILEASFKYIITIYSKTFEKPISFEISINTSTTTVNLESELSSQSIIIGEKLAYYSGLSDEADLSNLGLADLEATLRYNRHFISADLSSLKISNDLEGKYSIEGIRVNQIDPINDLEEIKFTLKSLGNYDINGFENLFNIQFDSFFPWYTQEQITEGGIKGSTIGISTHLSAMNNDCVKFNPVSINLTRQAVCADSLRQLRISKFAPALNIFPNPAENDFRIQYAIPFSGTTELRIFDAKGSLIYKTISEYLEAGEYDLVIPQDKLNSGLYNVILRSDTILKSQKLIYIK